MGQPDDRERSGKPPGRLRSALQVLRGETVVPDQIRWEWVEYQQRFNDLLDRYSASLARSAKTEKVRIKALHEALTVTGSGSAEAPPGPPAGGKAAIRARVASLKLRAGGALPQPEEEL